MKERIESLQGTKRASFGVRWEGTGRPEGLKVQETMGTRDRKGGIAPEGLGRGRMHGLGLEQNLCGQGDNDSGIEKPGQRVVSTHLYSNTKGRIDSILGLTLTAREERPLEYVD